MSRFVCLVAASALVPMLVGVLLPSCAVVVRQSIAVLLTAGCTLCLFRAGSRAARTGSKIAVFVVADIADRLLLTG